MCSLTCLMAGQGNNKPDVPTTLPLISPDLPPLIQCDKGFEKGLIILLLVAIDYEIDMLTTVTIR